MRPYIPSSRFRLVLVLFAAAAAGAWVATLGAQQPAASTPAQSGATFRATTRLVVQTVNVKDKDGHPVERLTVIDFTVTEDGEPQTVSFAEFERLPEPMTAAEA